MGWNGPLPPGSPSEKVGSLPPTFADGFPGGRSPLQPPTSTTLGFDISASFGAAPVYGYPKADGSEQTFAAVLCLACPAVDLAVAMLYSLIRVRSGLETLEVAVVVLSETHILSVTQ